MWKVKEVMLSFPFILKCGMGGEMGKEKYKKNSLYPLDKRKEDMVQYVPFPADRGHEQGNTRKRRHTMETISRNAVGNLIAHWRRMPTTAETERIRNMVVDAVAENGIRCFVEVETYRHTPSLGFGGIKATIHLQNPVEAVRDGNGTLIKGVGKITIEFDRCAGLYSFEEYCERQKKMDAIAKELGGYDKAFAAIDALPWDAESVDFTGWTDGKARDYRRRYFYPYEGRNHYCYDSTYEGLEEQLKGYMGNLARTLQIYNPAIVSRTAA